MERIKNFFKNMLALIGGFFLVAVISSVVLTIFWSSGKEPINTVKINPTENGTLQLTLKGNFSEKRGNRDIGSRLSRLFSPTPDGIYLPDIDRVLRHAEKNKQISRLFIRLEGVRGSWASFTSLRQSLERFKASKKPIKFWAYYLDTKNYYLATIADKIALPPLGSIDIPGPMLQLTYFGEALGKLGFKAEVVKTGKYKSAFETFHLDRPSPAALEMYQSIQASIRKHIADAIKIGRTTEKEQTKDWFNKAIFTSHDAKTSGLIDEINYLDESKERWAQKEKSLTLKDYRLNFPDVFKDSGSSKGDARIALIEASGPIYMSRNSAFDQEIVLSELSEELDWALENDWIKGVVLHISSPGGSAIASDLLSQKIALLVKKKPVIACFGSVAASGGYYIAAPASQIIALPTTITGSIGVVSAIPNLKNFSKKFGVHFHTITQSARRRLYNPGQELNAADMKIVQEAMNHVYKTFVDVVAKGRSMSVDQVEKVAQGRVWTGAQGKTIGLVDRIGGLPEAFDVLHRSLKLDPSTPLPIARWQKAQPSVAMCLLKNIEQPQRCLGSRSLLSSVQGKGSSDELLQKIERGLSNHNSEKF